MPVGVVNSVIGKRVRVVFSEGEACSSCMNRHSCVQNCNNVFDFECEDPVAVGDSVEVRLGGHSFLMMAVLCYGVPLFLLALIIFCLGVFITTEWVLGLIAIFVCGLWFVVLRFFKKRVNIQVKCNKFEDFSH